MNPDILDPEERCASTSNRNFEGRQGARSRTHLMSPAMAAAAGIAGHFVDIREHQYKTDSAVEIAIESKEDAELQKAVYEHEKAPLPAGESSQEELADEIDDIPPSSQSATAAASGPTGMDPFVVLKGIAAP